MEKATIPIRPLLYSHLATSNPDSHRISKRIKGLLGYSEHYKGDRIDFPDIDCPEIACDFPPLRVRDYRKARELTLEIWDPMIHTCFLERFLKSQKNLQTIRIKVLTEDEHERDMLKRLCGILSKIGRLSRVHIDFDKEQMRQIWPGFIKRVRPMRTLPKLKDLDVTADGKQVLPFSVGLANVGFDGENDFLTVKDLPVIQKLVQKTLKFERLDTIRIDSANFPDKFFDALVLVISKLPNFRELDFDYSKDFYLPMEQQIFNILDALAKAPKFEILRLRLEIKGVDQISLLEHPLFIAKSLKRVSLSLFFSRETTPKNLNRTSELLQTMPSLYELDVDLSDYITMNDEIAEAFMRRFSEITSLRKLKIQLAPLAEKLTAKQAGNMVRSKLNKMVFLEELDLNLGKNCIDLGGNNDIEGLPRLRKACIQLVGWAPERENDLRGVVEILGRCPQLRELELGVQKSVKDYQGFMKVLCESLRKLKELEVFKVYVSAHGKKSNMTISLLEDLVRVFESLRRFQDLTIQMGLNSSENHRRYACLYRQLSVNKKYRRVDMLY